MSDPHDDPEDPRYHGLYIGQVTNNVDPEGVGRVRFQIPGFIEPESAWAFPLGTLSGGGPQQGAFFVPPIGSDVGVLFHMGDVDMPYYLGGHWGREEVPSMVEDVEPIDRPKIRSIETKKFQILIDDRTGDQEDLEAGKERLLIRYKDTDDDYIEIDGLSRGVVVSGTSAVIVKAVGLIELNALQVQFNLGGIVRRLSPHGPKDF